MNRFFESSYLTWEIIPAGNLKFITDTFDRLKYLEDNEVNTWKHTETSDYFFQQRPIGQERPFPLAYLNISANELTAIFLEHGLVVEENIIFVEDIEMRKYSRQIQNANCFSNLSYAVFFNSENNTVKYIWFDYDDRLSEESDRLNTGKLLNLLGGKYSFILVDWYEKLVIDLSDKKAVIKYLDDTAESNKLFFQKISGNK